MGDWTGTVPTILAGDVVTGDDWQNITDELTALADDGTPWVPTLTNLTLGDGTQTAKYRRVGKWVDWYWQFLLGSTSAVGTSPTFTLPAAPASFYVATNPAFPGSVHLLDTGVAERQGTVKISSGSTLGITFWNATPALAAVTATAPWTWATGDYMTAWGTYLTT